MPSGDSRTQLAIAVAAAIVLMLLVCLVAPAITTWHRGKLADRLTAEVASAKDSTVKVPLRQLSELGDSSLEPLVVAAASERDAVSAFARQIINEKLTTWKLRAEATSRKNVDRDFITSMKTLAKAFALHIDEFGPAGKQWVERLALAMIELSDTLPAQQSMSLLDDCSRALAAVPPRGPRLRTVASLVATSTTRSLPVQPTVQPSLEPLTRMSDSSLETLTPPQPKSTLEFQRQLPPAHPETPRQPEHTEAVVTVIEPKPAGSQLNWSQQRSKDLKQPTTTKPGTTLVGIQESADKRPDAENSEVVDVPTPQNMQEQAAILRQRPSDELLTRLRKANFYEAGIIRTVLSERGFAVPGFAVLRRLAAPEVANRLRLVDEVSVLPAATARQVLRWLLEDESADVRLRALTVLATSNAPHLYEMARELAVRDEDPRVSELASRLLRQVR